MAASSQNRQRRVYLLPDDLLDRINQFQRDLNLRSEVDAVRLLLREALEARDTVETILDRLVTRYKIVRDLRSLAGEILTPHPLVTSTRFEKSEVYFTLGSDETGRFNRRGEAYIITRTQTGDEVVTQYPQKS